MNNIHKKLNELKLINIIFLNFSYFKSLTITEPPSERACYKLAIGSPEPRNKRLLSRVCHIMIVIYSIIIWLLST
jgi:hypothetical protein